MKKLIATILTCGFMLNVGMAAADPVGGMLTGALIGSVFGPDKKHRTENALIGAAAGALLGSQVAYSQEPAYRTHYAPAPEVTTYYSAPRSYTRVVETYPQSRAYVYDDDEPRSTVIVERYPRERTVIVEQPSTVVYYPSGSYGRHHRRSHHRW